MRKFLILLYICLSFITFAKSQAPQGINYQAVAYNSSGQPVTNQSVGVRLSVLDGGADGPVLYSETQTPNTDNTGLFSIVFGNGNLVSGTFADINWANGSRWLKTEIDIAGGNNYVVMGSSQFMSVPYALYSEKAGFASKAGPATSSFVFPDGFDDITPVIIPANTNYTVPTGKNLYIPNSYGGVSINGDTLFPIYYNGAANAESDAIMGVSANSIVSFTYTKACFLINKTVDWVTFDFSGTSYTVPPGKQLIVTNESYRYYSISNIGNTNCKATLNGISLKPEFMNFTNSVLDEGSVISTTGCTASLGHVYIITGYLKDK